MGVFLSHVSSFTREVGKLRNRQTSVLVVTPETEATATAAVHSGGLVRNYKG
jgi:hypothetical protein